MRRTIAILILLVGSRAVWSTELPLDQRLILACFNVDVDHVVESIRKGANVNATFGASHDDTNLLRDKWSGSSYMGSESWTPLIAVANAPGYPPPPMELGEIWKDRERAAALRKKIPNAQIEKRRLDSIIIVAVLLSHRCALDADDGFGSTALAAAVRNDKVEMARILLRFGGDPNTKSRTYIDGPSDVTPLHEACHSQELVQLLLDHGADASAKDSNGRTPAEWVAVQGDDRTFDLVLTAEGWRTQERNRRVK